MSIAEVHMDQIVLPDTPYAMWRRGELDDYLHAPEGSKVEVIGGQIVVSPPPALPHNVIIQDVVEALVKASVTDPSFPWACVQTTSLDRIGIGDGYIPDLVVLGRDTLDAANATGFAFLVPDQIELAVEVTSESNADNDRRPTERQARRTKPTKWTSYAHAEIPYYLLIDRDPKAVRVTLYSIPDQSTGAYLHQEAWGFGETIRLPDPFDIEITTARWRPW